MAGRRGGRGRSVAVGAVLVTVLLGALTWAVALQSPLFHVRHIEVRGSGRLPAEAIASAVDHLRGTNLLVLSVEEVARRVARDPWIAEASVSKDLPSTVVVRVREHVPVAWVRDRAGGVALASDGTALDRRPGEGLVAMGSVDRTLEPGAAAPVARPALRVVGSLPPRIRVAVAKAEVGEEGVVLRMRSGARVLYGPASDLGVKRATLRALMSWIAEHEVPAGLIDLRAPGTPAIRPERGSGSSLTG